MVRTIADIAKDIGSGLTPLRSNPLFWNSPDISWLKTEQLGAHVIYDTKEYISQKAMDETSIKLWPSHTVSVAMYGEGKTRGNASIIMSEMTTNQACCNVIVDDSLADYRFLYYWLKYNYEQLRSLASGVRKNLNSDDIKNFPFPDFGLDNQISIAEVLSSIDDKIDCNSKICTELESMAKTLYDYWFVQFDFPDEKGKPYRTNSGIMGWNETLKRYIPINWKIVPLGECCDTLLGGTPDTTIPGYWNGNIAWLNSGEIVSSPVLTSEKTITEAGRDNSSTSFAKAGAVVLSITRYIRPSILGIDACFNQSVVAVLPSAKLKTSFIYPFLQSMVPMYMSLRTGVQQPHINKDIVDKTYVVYPEDDSILNKYYERADRIYDLWMVIAKQTKALIELRDWLLPMLMNGQATISDIDNERTSK